MRAHARARESAGGGLVKTWIERKRSSKKEREKARHIDRKRSCEKRQRARER